MTAPVARITLLAALGGLCLAAPARAGGCYGSECYRRVVAPPVYETVQETVLVRPPRTIYRTVPPVYDTLSERVMVSPGGRFWQTSRGAGGELIGCWVSTPPRFAVRTRTVLVRPAQSIPETIPAEYATVSRHVLAAPARAGWVPVGGYGYRPAAYGGPLIGSIPDALGMTGASASDLGVALGFSNGSRYEGY